MPGFLRGLAVVGTAAMIWVGGGIILHGLEEFGLAGPAHFVHHLAEAAGHAAPALGGAVAWLVGAAGAGLFGLALGLLLIPLSEHVLAPVLRTLMALRPTGRGA
jgi:predicted DNA repair protein MutK